MNLQQLHNQFIEEIKDIESDAFKKINNEYLVMIKFIEDEWRDAVREIDTFTASNERISVIYKEVRMRNALEKLLTKLEVNSAVNSQVAQKLRDELILVSQEHAKQYIENGMKAASIDNFNPSFVNVDAITSLIASINEANSPISKLYDSLALKSKDKIRKIFAESILRGDSPRRILTPIKDSLNVNSKRAMMIARTESMRAYNSSNMINYRNNESILEGWIWSSSLGMRTCAICLSLHGKEFSLDEDFTTHPSCRCSPIPFVKGDDRKFKQGEDWLQSQSKKHKQKILGIKGEQLFTKGIPLDDFIYLIDRNDYGIQRRLRNPI